MRKIVFLIIILFTFSCKEDENIVEDVFLENLKVSAKDYLRDIEQASTSIDVKYLETKQSCYKEDIQKLKFCRREIEKSIKNWDSMNSNEIIESNELLVKKLNSMEFGIKYEFDKNTKLNSLSKEILIEYFRNKLYKPLLNNYIHSLRNRVTFCGYVKYTKNGIEDDIKNLEYEIEGLKEALKKYHWN